MALFPIQEMSRCFIQGSLTSSTLPSSRSQSTVLGVKSGARSMKKRVLYGLLFVVLGLNLYIGAEIYFASAQAAEKNNLYQQMDIFVRVMEKVRQEYVEGDKVSYDDLMRGALNGMLSTLDPHSEFMEPAKHEDLKKDTQGEFGGVGIVVSIKDNSLTLV